MSHGERVLELTRIAFRFRLEGTAVKVHFEGEQPPDPAADRRKVVAALNAGGVKLLVLPASSTPVTAIP